MNEQFARISEIMRRHGVQSSPEAFHAAVNVTFHQFEAEVYDEIHEDMWKSLPSQFALLAEDCLVGCPDLPQQLDLLDIGCGTGLASSSMLQSPLGGRIRSVHLLDTSSAMLAQAQRRGAGWGLPVEATEGTLDVLISQGRQFGLIVTCSVLHHVPDLSLFLHQVRALQDTGGIFLHLQDPNADFLNSSQLRQRMERTKSVLPESIQRLNPQRVLGRLVRELTRKQGRDYISKTNQALQQQGVITNPLSTSELFEITDIHAQEGEGISIHRLHDWLSEYRLLATRSYGFFGKLCSELPDNLRAEEEACIAGKHKTGIHIGAVWALSGHPAKPQSQL